ncbi:MAG: hypothetical protein EA385_05925 [Salinarimonadaceae bacterium]|nr:MAG: hypothetical protein EA385_05925 [Salinarimonadaceae bacterium]
MLAALKSLARAEPPPEPDDGSGTEASVTPNEVARPAEPEQTPFTISVFDRGEPCFTQDFAAGEVVIGGDPESDIVITDIDTPEVAVLRLERIGAACLVTITALCGGVMARGRELPVGRPLVFPDGARFTVAGDYAFEVAFAAPQAVVSDRRSAPLALLGVAAAFAAAGWILSEPLPRPAAPPPASGIEEPTTARIDDAPLRAPPLAEAVDPGARLASAEADLRARLVSANLVPPVRVSRRGGTLAVEGSVTAQERERLVDVLQAFLARARVPLEMALESEPATTPFFTSVVLRPQTFVIGADGRRYGLGQRLPDGGMIEKIDETSIVVNRDGLRERVDYAR